MAWVMHGGVSWDMHLRYCNSHHTGGCAVTLLVRLFLHAGLGVHAFLIPAMQV